MKANLRCMIGRDLPEVLDIESASFADPWDAAELRKAKNGRNCLALTADSGGRVVGYAVYRLREDRIEVLRLAVAPDRRHEGIGRMLVVALKSKLRFGRREALEVVARETNVAGCLFLKAMGFKAVRVVRESYADTGEDAIEMRFDAIEQQATAFPHGLSRFSEAEKGTW